MFYLPIIQNLVSGIVKVFFQQPVGVVVGPISDGLVELMNKADGGLCFLRDSCGMCHFVVNRRADYAFPGGVVDNAQLAVACAGDKAAVVLMGFFNIGRVLAFIPQDLGLIAEAL